MGSVFPTLGNQKRSFTITYYIVLVFKALLDHFTLINVFAIFKNLAYFAKSVCQKNKVGNSEWVSQWTVPDFSFYSILSFIVEQP